MSQDPSPYTPPHADLGSTPPTPPEKGSGLKAVVIALLVDIALTFALSVVFMVLYGAYLAATGMNAEQIALMVDDPSENSTFTTWMLVIGGGCSILGGYLCSRIARHSEYRLGAMLIAISLVLGWAMAGREYPPQLLVMSTIVTIFAIAFGVWVGERRNRQLNGPAG